MQENEFEKQVNQRMNEFRLRPSEPVWAEIEKELRDNRRRRFILIPLFAALLVAGYFAQQSYFHAPKISSPSREISIKNNSNNNQTKNTVDKNNNSSDKIGSQENKVSKENNGETSASNTPTPGSLAGIKSGAVNNSENTKEEKSITGKLIHRKKESNQIAAISNPIVSSKKNQTTGHAGDKVTLIKTNKEKNIIYPHKNKTDPDNLPTEKYNGLAQSSLVVDPIEAAGMSERKLQPDSTPVIIDEWLFSNNLFSASITGNKIAGLQLPSFRSPGSLQSSKSIKFAITFSVGASSRVNKPLQVVGSEDKSIAATAQYAGSTGNSFNNIGGGVSILPPSNVMAGAAFKIGAITMKPLSRRVDISAGLQYSYSSDHIRVGKSIASPSSFPDNRYLTAQAYYPNVQNVNHANKYHYIELPVSVYYNLNKKWKTPFVWNAGMAVSRLLSSDVLLYDITWGGVYYKGNKDLRKTQVNISTGFAIRFTGRNHWQWNVGPQVYMGVTKLFQSDYDKNKHPVYGGLNIQVILPGKKKIGR